MSVPPEKDMILTNINDIIVINNDVNSIEKSIFKYVSEHKDEGVYWGVIDDTNNIYVYGKVKKVILLNFEDDTFKAVKDINKKYILVINEWYDKCNQMIDFENTEIVIPDTVEEESLSTVLYTIVNCKNKDLFVNSYFPEILNSIAVQQKINIMESKLSIVSSPEKKTHSIVKKNKTLTELNISIPSNLVYFDDYFYTNDENKIILLDTYKKRKPKETLKSTDIMFMTNEERMVSAIKSKKTEENIIVQPYNSDYNFNESEMLKCYNDGYNSLNPEFGLNCESIITRENKYFDTKLIVVIFNPMFFQTVVLVNPDLIMIETLFDYTEYGFIELFTINTNNDEIELLVKKQYDSVIFNGIEELNQTLMTTSQFVEFIKTKQQTNSSLFEEEKTVKEYFKNHFILSSDINNKMKASTLYDIIITTNICKFDDESTKLSNFRNRLSKYLTDLGLQKKRYNDGYYYYGISFVNNTCFHQM